jgi:DNA polymerase-4
VEAARTQDERRRAELGAHLLHVRCPAATPPEDYQRLLSLLADITPVVQPLLPLAVAVDVAGAIRYFDLAPRALAQRIQLRAIALLALDLRIGVAANLSLAAMASAMTGPDGIRLVPDDPQAVSDFLSPLPVDALYGVGPRQAAKLTKYGLHTIGALAATRPDTVQRILGGKAGRLLHDRARGIDPRPVVPAELPASVSEQRLLDYDTLDPDRLRTELLDAVVAIGDRLRRRHQVAGALTLTVSVADGSQISRSKTFPEATHHTDDLRTAAYTAFNALGLQRARVRGLMVRAERLVDAGQAAQQISMDRTRENALRVEPAIDRLNDRFGPGTVTPASLAYRRSA